MRANWCWQAGETTLSDLVPTAVWSPHALLHRPQSLATFVRQGWDKAQIQDFGPWRLSTKPDPLAGQTEVLTGPEPPMSPTDAMAGVAPGDADPIESVARVPSGVPEDVVAQRVQEANRQGWQQGHDEAVEAMQAAMQAERASLQALAQALHALQSNSAALLEPLKKLALHVAQELVRGELRLDAQVIERLIAACVDALDHPAETVLIQISPADMGRLQGLTLPGVNLEVDDTLQEGSVRAKVNDTQVEDLIEHRLAAISRQIMGEAP